MPGVITAAASSTSAWNYGGSIMTFAFPMILFLTVAISLYVVFTKPSVVPGHREQTVARPIGFTPMVSLPRQETGEPAVPAGPHYAFPSRTGQQTAPGTGGAAGPQDPGARGESPEGTE